jgi:hypothetical protein
VQALTCGRKKPLNWCCNLISSFIFSKFHLTAHIFSLAYFFSQPLTSVLHSASLFSILLCWTLIPCISSPGCYNIARQLTDYQTQHAENNSSSFCAKVHSRTCFLRHFSSFSMFISGDWEINVHRGWMW